MAFLERVTSNFLWLEADSLAPNAGVTVSSWFDQSGNNNDFITTVGTAPTLALNATPSGKPALLFGGAGGLSGPLQNAYFTAGNNTAYVVFKATTITTNSATIQANDTMVGGSGTNAPCLALRNNGPNYYARSFDGATASVATSIVTNQWYVALFEINGSGVNGQVDDAYSVNTTATGAPTSIATAGRIGVNFDGTAFMTGYIAAILHYRAAHTNVQRAEVMNYLASKYLIRGDATEETRDAISRRLIRYSQPRLQASITVPLTFADVDLLDDVALSHPLGVTSSSSGWGNTAPNRRPMRVVSSDIDLDNLKIKLAVKDLKGFAINYYDTAIPTKTASVKRVGQAIVGSSVIRSFTRDSDAYVIDAGDGHTIVKVTENVEKVQFGGFVIESSQGNYITKSSFIPGTSSLTLSGTGVGGSAITASSSTPLLFTTSSSDGGSGFSLMFTAGNPHTTLLLAAFPAVASSNLPSNSISISADHRDANGTALTWVLQRSVDSLFYNSAGSSWGAARVFNAFPITATSTTITRDNSGSLLWGTGATAATNLTLSIGLPSSGAASRVNHAYHVEMLGDNPVLWRGTRVVTNGARVLRAMDALYLTNNTSELVSSSRGTILFNFVPQWNSSEINTPYMFSVSSTDITTNNRLALAYDTSTAFIFGMEGAAAVTSSQSAYYQIAVVAGTTYAIATRWTSTEGEVGTTGRTLSVFVNGAKGSDYAVTATSGYSAGSQVAFGRWTIGGSVLAGSVPEGAITNLTFLPYCLSDDEIAAWSS